MRLSNPIVRVTLAARLMSARESAGLSQAELSARSGVGTKSISSFETGTRIDSLKVSQLLAIMEACNVDPRSFLRAIERTSIVTREDVKASEEARCYCGHLQRPEHRLQFVECLHTDKNGEFDCGCTKYMRRAA